MKTTTAFYPFLLTKIKFYQIIVSIENKKIIMSRSEPDEVISFIIQYLKQITKVMDRQHLKIDYYK